MSIVGILIVCLYIALIIYMVIGFNQVPTFKTNQKNTTYQFSILIPFRNEAENLPQLIDSITKIDYTNDGFEIIFINDDSDDKSVEIVNQFINNSTINVTLINNHRFSNSPKKDALTIGIKSAAYDWIVTTDADCEVPKSWLLSFSQFIEEQNPILICGPVVYNNVNFWLSHFQNFELLSLMSFTIGGFGNKKPFLCNGANLCYQKALFEKINGYTNNNNIASGDDVFLLENTLNIDAQKVHFIKAKQVLVYTNAASTIRDTIQQRIRWASKSSQFNNSIGKLIGILILLMNGLLVSLVILCLVDFKYLLVLSYGYFIKMIADGLIIISMKSFLEDKNFPLFYYLTSSIVYPFFTVYVAILSVFLPYKWKGRRFTK